MKAFQQVSGIIGISALILAAQSTLANENLSGIEDQKDSLVDLNQEQKIVGFAPSKALRTLESLAQVGASHFNTLGEVQIQTNKLPSVIQAAMHDSLEAKVLPSADPGFIKLKFSNLGKGNVQMTADQMIRLKNITGYYKLKCDGGTTEN